MAEDEAPGFMDLVAGGEAQLEPWNASLLAISEDIATLGRIAQKGTAEIQENDAHGGGMRGRLTVAAKHANRLDEVADRLEGHVADYIEAISAVSSANLAIIGRVEENPDLLTEALEFGMILRRLANVARGNSESFNGLVASLQENARLSRVVRPATRRIVNSLDQFNIANELLDEWDRRLQALAIPVPAEDWQPSPETTTPTGEDTGADAQGGTGDA